MHSIGIAAWQKLRTTIPTVIYTEFAIIVSCFSFSLCVCVFSSTFCGDSWHAIEPPIRTAHLATYVAEASTKNCGVMPEVVDVCRQVDKEVQIIWKYPDHSNLCPEFIESTDWVGMVHYTHNTCPRQTPCLLYCLEFCIFFFFICCRICFDICERYIWRELAPCATIAWLRIIASETSKVFCKLIITCWSAWIHHIAAIHSTMHR